MTPPRSGAPGGGRSANVRGENPAGNEVLERREDGSFLLDGALHIDQLKTTLQLRRLPGEEEGGFQTLGGFLMTRLGRVPAVTDHVDVGGWRLEVVDMDRQRVDKVLATPIGTVTRAPTSG